ncbi:MAG: Nramp family divalent metal transporter [Verrucomicrobiota bacterium]|jgi:Mn2+/Fe2+ NRAMP family transporter|nr:Nramp family divalent metal transporter [Verrucomicrobiota bacterium]MDP7050005.1 Nramp family divalent metal transporter [Verrucomicrobiota bacterium]
MDTKPAPTTFKGILRHLGPGLIITATIVGSGELIATPKLASEVGFKMLWFIILGCLVKVFVQVELGRYTLVTGKTTLEAMNSVPGPKLRVSWMVWFWVVMYIGSTMQVAGMMGGIASLVIEDKESGWHLALIGIIAIVCMVMLLSGRYRLVERVCIVMVVLFTFFTILALASIQFTDNAITASKIGSGLTFWLPPDFAIAFGAFAIIGVGTSELIYYPYWCIEKGYAKNTGEHDKTIGWLERALGWLNVMRWDAWISCVIYTGATVAFYLLGAATLYNSGQEITDDNVISSLSAMYESAFGEFGKTVFSVGCFCVLFSTVFAATAANSRLFADGVSVFGIKKYQSEDERHAMVKFGAVVLLVLAFIIFAGFGKPVSLVFMGAFAQGALLPFLAFASIYFLYTRVDRKLHPGKTWKVFLSLSAICMAIIGAYSAVKEVSKRIGPETESAEMAPASTNSAPVAVEQPKE